MSLRKKMNRIRYIDSLIFKKATGDPKSLSKKLSLSVSGTSKIIREMKEEGFPICYCKNRKTYFYTKEGKMTSNLFDTDTTKDELEQLKESKLFLHYFPNVLIVD